MSVVTNTILAVNGLWRASDEIPRDVLRQINAFFEEDGLGRRGFVGVDDPLLPPGWYGGTKHLQVELFIGAFNHLRIADLVRHLKSLDWEADAITVQLLVMEEDDHGFRIIEVLDRWSR